jgi:hypothetical protein
LPEIIHFCFIGIFSLRGHSLTTLELSGCINVTDVFLVRCFTRPIPSSQKCLLNVINQGHAFSKRGYCYLASSNTRDDYVSCCRRTSNNKSMNCCQTLKPGGCSDLVLETALMLNSMALDKKSTGCKIAVGCSGCKKSQQETFERTRQLSMSYPLERLSLSGCWQITDAALMLVYCCLDLFLSC